MARHPHCSGQHSGRQRATTSPRRREVPVEDNESAPRAPRRHLTYVENDEPRIERERKRLRLDIREAADKKEGIRVREKREKRELGGFKSLAHLSSDPSSSPRSSSPSERAPLAPKNPNALRRHSSAVEEPVCARDPKWPQRPITRLPVIPSAFPQRSQLIPSAFPQRSQVIPSAFPGRQRTEAPRDLSQPSSSSKTAPVKPSLATQSSRPPAASSTPRARRIAHHHVTPPKSRTPQRRDMQETLFELPPAPRQPVFRPVSPTPVRDWQPVEMQAETLMTWSMGGANPASVEQPAPPSSPPIREGEYSDEPIRVVEVVDDDETNCVSYQYSRPADNSSQDLFLRSTSPTCSRPRLRRSDLREILRATPRPKLRRSGPQCAARRQVRQPRWWKLIKSRRLHRLADPFHLPTVYRLRLPSLSR